MIGLSKSEVLQQIDNLNDEKYQTLYNQKRTDLIKKHGDMTADYIEQFFLWYTQELLPLFTADLIEINNKKITEDIQKLLPR